MTLVGSTLLGRNHADDLIPAHLCTEGTADTAVGAGGFYRARRSSELDDVLLLKGARGTCLNAGSAGDTLAIHEQVATGAHLGLESAALNRERERTLNLTTGPDTATAGDALGLIEGEVGIAVVRGCIEVVLTLVSVAHIAQSDHTGHLLQLTVAIGWAGEAVQRVVGDVQLHDPLAQLLKLRGLGVDDHPWFTRRGTGRGGSTTSVHLNQAQPTGTECTQGVGGAQLGYGQTDLCCCSHDRGTSRHLDGMPINRDADGLLS